LVGGGPLLDAPAHDILDGVAASAPGFRFITDLIEHVCSKSVGSFLEAGPDHFGCVAGSNAAAEVAAASELISAYMTREARRPADPAPQDLAALRAWAAERSVAQLLGAPVDALLGMRPSARTFEEAWSADPAARPALEGVLRGAVRATRAALDEEAAAGDRRLPGAPAARALTERLLRTRARVRSAALPLSSRERSHASVRVDVDGLSASIEGSLALYPGGMPAPIAARLALGRGLDPEASCSCGSPACAHVLALIDEVLDALAVDPPGPAIQRLAARTGVPAWKRLIEDIDAIETGAARPGAPGEQLAWRIGPSGTVEGYVERLTKNGKPTLGRKVPLDEAQRWLAASASPADRALLDVTQLIADGGYHSWSVSGALAHRLIHALIGHPRVWLREGDRSQPLSVREARLEIRVEESEEGVRLDPFLDGALYDGRSLQREIAGSIWVHLDVPARICSVAKLTTEAQRLARTLAANRAFLPPEARDELLQRVPKIEQRIPFDRATTLKGAPIEADATVIVQLEPDAGATALSIALGVRPIAGGPVFPPGEGPLEVHGVSAGALVFARRDLDRERALADALVASLPGLVTAAPAGSTSFVLRDDDALDLIRALEERGDAIAVEWPGGVARWRIAKVAGPKDLRLAIEDRDWFGITGGIDVGEERLRIAALLEAARTERRFVKVGASDYVAISDALKQRLLELDGVTHESRGVLEIGPAGPALLATLADEIGEMDTTARWRETRDRIDRAATLEPIVPERLQTVLRPYQADGFRWLMRLASWGAGACLADDMGLGKTVQGLAVLVARAKLGPALVVAPTSVGFNWVREAARFAPELRTHLLREMGRDARRSTFESLGPGDVLIVGYGLLAREIEALAGVRFASFALDEAQAIKNAETDRAIAARRIDAEWRFALTGTPIENHVGELWSLFRVIAPGLFGSAESFRRRFGLRPAPGSGGQALARVIRPFMLRRKKDEVARDLPAKTEARVDVMLASAERSIYEDARLAAVAHLTGALDDLPPEQRRFQVLAAITRLRQLACHPRLVDPTSAVPSSKLRRLVEILEELRAEGHRALVFSQFTSHLALVREALDAAGIRAQYLDGKTPPAERRARVDAFQSGDATVFLLSLKAGGTGLNLTGADYVIHLDPWWNPAVEDQASDRAHRIGQQRPVTVLRLVSQGTIEEAILGLHADKRALVSEVLDGTGVAATITTEELVALIRHSDPQSADSERPRPARPGKLLIAPVSPPKTLPELFGSTAAGLRALRDEHQRFLEEETRATKNRNLASYGRIVGRFVDLIIEDAGVRPESSITDLVGIYARAIKTGTVPPSDRLQFKTALGRFADFANAARDA